MAHEGCEKKRKATFKFEMFCAKKKQGEFGITLAEIKSVPNREYFGKFNDATS